MAERPLRLLCDEMLARLGRWLRAAGHDVAIAAGEADSELLARAGGEARVLLTRDRALAARSGAGATVVLLRSERLAEQAAELSGRLGVDWLHAPFTRCLECNEPLRPATGAEALRAPEPVRSEHLRACPRCERVYWAGGHERRMRRALTRFAESRDLTD